MAAALEGEHVAGLGHHHQGAGVPVGVLADGAHGPVREGAADGAEAHGVRRVAKEVAQVLHGARALL